MLFESRLFLEDEFLSPYIKTERDKYLLKNLGTLYEIGEVYPIRSDLLIIEMFGRNRELYEALAEYPKTSGFIENNDFKDVTGFLIGAKTYYLKYTNWDYAFSYLKDYLEYVNVLPNYDEFYYGFDIRGEVGNLVIGQEVDETYTFHPASLYEEYVKWW